MLDDASVNPKAPLLDDDTGFPVEDESEEQEPLLMETDPLLVPGALEVEESVPVMSETVRDAFQSDEMTSSVRDAAGSILSQSDILDVQDESAMGLKELLAEANLGERHLRFCAFALIGVLILGFGGLYLWLKPESAPREVSKESSFVENTLALVEDWTAGFGETWSSWFAEDSSEDSGKVKAPQGLPSIVVGSDRWNKEEEFAKVEASSAGTNLVLDLSYSLGELRGEDKEAFETAEALGMPKDLQDPFYDFVEAWVEAKRLMAVDVQGMVLGSSNRRDALEDYVQDLRRSMASLETIRVQLQKESEALEKNFNILQAEKEKAEQEYFDALSAGYSSVAVNALQSFIQKGEAIVGLRAHYLARTRLSQNMDRAIPLIEARIKDVEANKEAVIQGIKVYEFSRSDLELILDGDSL